MTGVTWASSDDCFVFFCGKEGEDDDGGNKEGGGGRALIDTWVITGSSSLEREATDVLDVIEVDGERKKGDGGGGGL
jgi:hypothetical protein